MGSHSFFPLAPLLALFPGIRGQKTGHGENSTYYHIIQFCRDFTLTPAAYLSRPGTTHAPSGALTAKCTSRAHIHRGSRRESTWPKRASKPEMLGSGGLVGRELVDIEFAPQEPEPVVVAVPEQWLDQPLTLEIKPINMAHYAFSAGSQGKLSEMETAMTVSSEPVSWGFDLLHH
ncbi:hypothetical protein MKZ38_001479 [Zalerion maritima]|uniref:Uncharacterized protein n=1 Tax=Zalerion maritima TaxID=339359 RepID=A0AAD5RZ28_9PEZI|nr:hypothetical protein MKZ38_001479 [Zalerion maritima]